MWSFNANRRTIGEQVKGMNDIRVGMKRNERKRMGLKLEKNTTERL
jgi:hypothetical protein